MAWGGAGIDLTVIGGTSQPASPSENTVWVNTATSIGEVYIQSTAPESPAAGDVWINNFVKGETLQVSESPYLEITVGTVKQYNGSSWTDPDVQIYKNGAWHTSALYIFSDGKYSDYGVFDTGYSGSSSSTSPISGISITTYGGETCLKVPLVGSSTYYTRYISSPIDVTKYNTMSVTAHSPNLSGSSSYPNIVGLDDTLHGITSTSSTFDVIAYKAYSDAHEVKMTSTVDISSISGNYYVGIFTRSNLSGASKYALYVYEIALLV